LSTISGDAGNVPLVLVDIKLMSERRRCELTASRYLVSLHVDDGDEPTNVGRVVLSLTQPPDGADDNLGEMTIIRAK
jgi:hypothetical protein